MANEVIEQAREHGQRLAQRWQDDPEFQKKLHDDPEGTLKAEGVSDEAAQVLLAEAGLAEVSGYAFSAEQFGDCNCAGYTCCFTALTTTYNAG